MCVKEKLKADGMENRIEELKDDTTAIFSGNVNRKVLKCERKQYFEKKNEDEGTVDKN